MKPKIHKPFSELFGQPRARGKAANEKRKLVMINQQPCSKMSEYTDCVDGKALLRVISDSLHGGLNRGFEELRNLRARREFLSADSLIE